MDNLVSIALEPGLTYYATPDDNRYKALARGAVWESEVTAYIREHLKAGMTFVDVGAQNGYFTIIAARLVGDGKVIAFEPQAKCREILLTNLEWNRLGDKVVVSQLALYSRDIWGSVEHGDIFSPGEHGTTKAATLDAYLHGECVNIIKIDVEGCEFDVLVGAMHTLVNCKPTLIVELHPVKAQENFGHDVSGLMTFLHDFDYATDLIDYGGDIVRVIREDLPAHILATPAQETT